MAEGYSASGANDALAGFVANAVWIQLHTGHPGAAGTTAIATNNVRKEITWNSPSAGSVDNDGNVEWDDVAASETYAFASLWTAESAGTFKGSGAISGGVVSAGNNFVLPDGDIVVAPPLAS